jgi:hypothetical protein
MRKLWLIFGLVVVVATLILMAFGKQIACYFHEEVFKLLAQLVILFGIGGLGHLILTEINTARERRDANRTLLRTTLDDLIGAYNEVKSVRRRLRAEAVRPNVTDHSAHVLKEPYAALLQTLNDAQLKLEAQLRLIEGNEAQYPESEKLIKLLGGAEAYLGNLISEWEDRLGSLGEAPEQNRLADFELLRPFLGDAEDSFKPGFANPMEKVFAIIGIAIAGISDRPSKKNKKEAEK